MKGLRFIILCAGVCAAILLGNPPAVLAAPVDPQVNQGIALYRKGYIQKAIPVLRQAVKAAPQSEGANLWLAKALIKQGGEAHLAEAREALTRALNTNPNQAEAMMLLGQFIGWNPSDRPQAIGLLRRALELQDSSSAVKKEVPRITRHLVELLVWEGRYREAAGYAQAIKDTFSADRKWQATYARILSHLGQAEEALVLYENYLKPMGGTDRELQLAYADALNRAGRQTEAQSVYGRIRDPILQSGETNLVNALSSLAYELGNYEDAARLDQSLPPALGESKDIRLRTGRALAKSRRHPEAVDLFHQVYLSGQMNADEKVEYADFLLGLSLPTAALPAPNLIETLYQEAMAEASEKGPIALRLARLYSSYGPDAYNAAARAYLQAYPLERSPAVKREMLDYLKSTKTHVAESDRYFKLLTQSDPDDTEIQGAYAEFLSWQPERRREAIEIYLTLARKDRPQRGHWAGRLEEVLGWHEPGTDWVALYDEILAEFPGSRAALLAKGRAYAANPQNYSDALAIFQDLKNDYPDDPDINREWVGLLSADKSRRKEALAALESLVEENPQDLATRVAYGKLLSYEARYEKALVMFDGILSEDPQNRDALVGKGYTLIWSGKRLKAKKLLEEARSLYPDDVEVALALAAAEKSIGRNDKALEILREIRPLLNYDWLPPGRGAGWIPCNGPGTPQANPLTFDFAIIPVETAPPKPSEPARASMPILAPFSTPQESIHPPVRSVFKPMPPSVQAGVQSADPADLQQMASELDSLSRAIDSLNAVQQQSSRQIDRLKSALWDTKQDFAPIQESGVTLTTSSEEFRQLSPRALPLQRRYGQGVSLYEDSSTSLLAGQGGYYSQEIARLEDALFADLRPEIRAGYAFQYQEGEPTTNELFSWGFPNQVSLSLTPQFRIRGGIVPRRYYLPNSPVEPRGTYGILYTLGATAKYWDRLTLDGDIGLTHFTQSNKENLTYLAQAKVEITDEISLKVGGRRNTLPNSLLSIAGFRARNGAFRGEILGPANENAVFTELNLLPFKNVDLNLGYEWALINGSDDMPENYKNQFFVSTGYTHRFNAQHSLRLGYEFLAFFHSKNATNGYFDLDSGVRRPLAVLRPPIPADSGFDYGGYFSPSRFFLNAFRLDYRGSAFNQFLEYNLGGSLGVQNFEHGFGIQDSDPTSMASAFNVALKLNFTDWLAAYGRTDFMDSGGLFSRWRFEGGLIVRPHIRALSPVFHGE